MDKDRLFFDILIFVAASMVIFEVAPGFNGFFGGVITLVTLIRIVDFLVGRKVKSKLSSDQGVQECDATEAK